MNARLGSAFVLNALFSLDHIPVKRVFDMGLATPGPGTEYPGCVGLIIGEKNLSTGRCVEVVLGQRIWKLQVWNRWSTCIVRDQGYIVPARRRLTNCRFCPGRIGPCPGITKPKVWQEVETCCFRTTVEGLNSDADVFRIGLRVFDKNVEIAIFIENAGIEKFELRTATLCVFRNQLCVWELLLRILVEHPHVAVRGRIVEIEPVFLCVLAVISFRRRQTEHSLFQDGIVTVPERKSKYQQLVAITNSCDAVLTPAVGLAASRVVSEEIPCRAPRAVVFTDSSPRTLTDIRTPFAPRCNRALETLSQTRLFPRRSLAGKWRCGWGGSSFRLRKILPGPRSHALFSRNRRAIICGIRGSEEVLQIEVDQFPYARDADIRSRVSG